jgi:hypothetical protein
MSLIQDLELTIQGMEITSGLYYKLFTIVIYEHNAIGQYYKTTIVDYDCS